DRVRLERHGWIAALLRAVMHQAVFAHIEIARARPTPPRIGLAVGQVALKARNSRIEILERLKWSVDRRRDVVVHPALDRPEWLEPARSVVDDADRCREPQFPRAGVDHACVLGILDSATKH